MNVFDPVKPARIRVENETTNVDAIVPAFLVLYPAADGSGRVQMYASFQTPAQLAAFVESAIRLGTSTGIMQQVMAQLGAGAGVEVEQRYARPDVPPDDLPPHLRRSPGPPGK